MRSLKCCRCFLLTLFLPTICSQFSFCSVPAPPEITLTGIKDVQVVEPKAVEVVVGSTILTISGNNVSLTCRVKGFPTPSVQWTKDGVSLDTEGSTLRLQAVEANDTGVYTCTATSSPLGLFDWASSNLTVIGWWFRQIKLTRFYNFKFGADHFGRELYPSVRDFLIICNVNRVSVVQSTFD